MARPNDPPESDALMRRIDHALARWPHPRTEGSADDATVAAIVARASGDAGGAGANADEEDDDVFGPPLPRTRDEGGGPAAPRRRGRPWVLLAGAMAAAASMAAGVAGIRMIDDRDGTRASTSPGPSASGAGLAATPEAPVRAPSSIDVPGVDPALLPIAADPGASPARPHTARTARPAASSGSHSTPGAPGNAPAGPLDPQPDESLRPAAGAAPGSGLAPSAWSVPRRPSMGAIQSGFASVLPAARACLGDGDAPYRATVTFQSDGSVGDVSLPGVDPAASGAACVKAALSKASVPPFAEGSYAAPVTVRSGGR